MSNYNKAIVYRPRYASRVYYFTRKDWRHKKRWLYGHRLKQMKHMTNVYIRNYKGEMQDGGWYKRFDDPWSYW